MFKAGGPSQRGMRSGYCLAQTWACHMACMPSDTHAHASEDQYVGADMTSMLHIVYEDVRDGDAGGYVYRQACRRPPACACGTCIALLKPMRGVCPGRGTVYGIHMRSTHRSTTTNPHA